MFTPIILLTALVLPCHTLEATPSQDPVAAPNAAQLTEDRIGLTLFRPIHANPRDLINYAKDLTESSIEFLVTNPGNGKAEHRRRDRFVVVEGSIGVQGDEAGRKQGVAFLTELDNFIGESRAERVAEATTLVRTVRLRSMGVGAALQLLDAMAAKVEKQVVAETGTIVLRGATEDVARAESLLLEVDKPAPQMTLHVTLIEAVDSAPTTPIGGELGRALAGLLPGKQFQQAGRFMLRGSVAGDAPLELSSSFGDHADAKFRFAFQARSRSWDAERKVLTLGGCEVRNDRPKFTPQPQAGSGAPGGSAAAATGSPGTPATPPQVHTGYEKEGFRTDLCLNQGQDTVVGSLGGSALLVVLRFTVDPSVN